MISKNPNITLEYTSETTRTLLFDPTTVDAEHDCIRQLAGDMNTQTANGIVVHLEDLPYGRLRICWNPVPVSDASLDRAVSAFCQRLRETCITCPDFNPDLYPGEDQ